MRRLHNQDGAVAVWFSIMIGFLFVGLAAVTVDVSEWFEDARAQQNAADFACLAGAAELANYGNSPALREARAYRAAAENLTSNVDAYRAASSADLAAGLVSITADSPWIRDDYAVVMEWAAPDFTVELGQVVRTRFGGALGRADVDIEQRAVCRVSDAGLSDMPFGVVPGTLGAVNASRGGCSTAPGNCHQLDIPRNDANSARELAYNIILGVQPELQVWGGIDSICTATSTTCNVVETYPGFDQGKLKDGFVNGVDSLTARLANLAGDTTPYTFSNAIGNQTINDDDYDEVVETSGHMVLNLVDTLEGAPVPSPIPLDRATHVSRCDHPRLARTPVLLDYPNGGSATRRIAGFVFQFVEDPDDNADFTGGSLDRVTGQPFLLADEATCADAEGVEHPLDTRGKYGVFELVE